MIFCLSTWRGKILIGPSLSRTKCSIRDTSYSRSTTIYTTCDSDGGASGSPILGRDANGGLVLRGMMTSSGLYAKDGEEYSLAGGNYALRCWIRRQAFLNDSRLHLKMRRFQAIGCLKCLG